MKKPRGYVLYEGPSQLDPAINIIAVAVMGSTNSKTGNMVQVYYLVADTDPQTASKTLMDSAVCGDCKHRQSMGGSCYVILFHGPRAVYDGYKRGIYSYDTEEFYERIKERHVRFGAYGDPAAAPTRLTRRISRAAAGRTGYTHQWQRREFDRELLDYVMVSTDSPEEYNQAGGARSFRVKSPEEPLLAGEIYCPSERVSCNDCRLCKGGSSGRSVAINVHGAHAGKFIQVREVA